MYRDVIYADYLPIHKLYSLLWQSSSIRGDHLWHSPFLFTISNALSQFENNLKAIKSLEPTITYSFLYGEKKLKTHIYTTIKNMHFKKVTCGILLFIITTLFMSSIFIILKRTGRIQLS